MTAAITHTSVNPESVDGGPEKPQETERDEEPHHVDIAVGEIDELDDAVDHGVAQRDEGKIGADGQAIEELLEEDFGAGHDHPGIEIG